MREYSDAKRLLFLLTILPEGIKDWKNNLTVIAPSFEDPHKAADILLSTSLAFDTIQDNLSILSPTRLYMQSKLVQNNNELDKDIEYIAEFIINGAIGDLLAVGVQNIPAIFEKILEKKASIQMIESLFGMFNKTM